MDIIYPKKKKNRKNNVAYHCHKSKIQAMQEPLPGHNC